MIDFIDFAFFCFNFLSLLFSCFVKESVPCTVGLRDDTPLTNNLSNVQFVQSVR